MRICLLYSENAGEGQSQGTRLRHAIESAGHEVAHLVEKDAELTRALEDAVDLVVAAGGDGTVARAATALASRTVPLAVLPLGTANNIARSLDISGPIEDIIRGWTTAEPAGLDLGTLSVAELTCPFVEGVGIGLIPRGIAAVPPEAHGPDDSAEEKVQRALSGYREVLAQLRPRRRTLALDGETLIGDFLLVEVLNIPLIGPALRLSPEVTPRDGLLSVVVAGERERAQLDGYLAAVANGRDARLDLPVHHARVVELRDVDEAHVDDDVRRWPGGETLTLTIQPAAIRTL